MDRAPAPGIATTGSPGVARIPRFDALGNAPVYLLQYFLNAEPSFFQSLSPQPLKA